MFVTNVKEKEFYILSEYSYFLLLNEILKKFWKVLLILNILVLTFMKEFSHILE